MYYWNTYIASPVNCEWLVWRSLIERGESSKNLLEIRIHGFSFTTNSNICSKLIWANKKSKVIHYQSLALQPLLLTWFNFNRNMDKYLHAR